jgi:hypothetical protein
MSLMTMSRPVFGFFRVHHGPPSSSCGAELLLRHFVAPVAEGALGELLDVALVHDGHRLAVVVDGVLDGGAHQARGALARHRLDADAGGVREADLLDAHLVLQELDELLAVVGFGGPFDAGVDVFRVLAEDHHVDLLGFFSGLGTPLK